MNTKIIILAVFCTLSVAYGRPSVEEHEREIVKREIRSYSQEELADVSAPTLRHTRAIPNYFQEELADVSAPTLRHTRAIPELSQEELADVSAPTHSIRHKRATCDLLSGFGVNHSACAAHCVVIGRKGGYCNGQAVCVCRN